MTVRATRLALVLLAGAILLAIVLGSSADYGRFKPQLESAVSDLLEREFVIEGPLHVELGRKISVEASDLRLAGFDTSSDPLLRIGRIIATVDVWSLLEGPVEIDLLIVERATVNLEERAPGDNNWTFEGRSNDELESHPSAGRVTLPVLLRDLQSADLKVRYSSPAFDRPVEVLSGATSLSMTDPDGLAANSSGTVNGTAFDLSVAAGDFEGLMALDELRFEAEGTLGEITFDASASLADVQKPRRPVGRLSLHGPNVEYLTDLLNLPQLTSGPLDLESSVAPDGGRMRVELSGQVGEFTAGVKGYFTDLAYPEDAELHVTARGPDFSRLVARAGIDGAPEAPFDIVGDVRRDGTRLSFHGIEATIGDTVFELDGVFGQFPSLSGAAASLRVGGPDLGQFNRLMGLPGDLDGEFTVDAELEPVAGGGASLAISARTHDVSYTVDARFTDSDGPPGWRARVSCAGPDLRTLGDALGLDDLPGHSFEGHADLGPTEGGLSIDNGRLRIGKDRFTAQGHVTEESNLVGSRLVLEASIADLQESLGTYGIVVQGLPDWPINLSAKAAIDEGALELADVVVTASSLAARLDGRLALPAPERGTEFDFTIEGDDFRALLPENRLYRALGLPFELAGRFTLEGASVRLSPLKFRLDGSGFVADGEVEIDRESLRTSLEATASAADLYRLSPDFESMSLPGTAPFDLRLVASLAGKLVTVDELEARIGDGWLRAQGTLEGPPTFERTDLDIDIRVADLRQLSGFAGRELPEQTFSAKGHLTGRPRIVRLEDFDVQLGESDLSGTVEYRALEKPEVKIAVASGYFDVTPYLEPRAEDSETPSAGEHKPAADDRVIPDTRLPFSVLHSADAEVSAEFARVRVRQRQLDDFRVVAELTGGSLEVHDFELTSEGSGTLFGTFGASALDRGGEVWARLRGSDIGLGIPVRNREELEALPRYDLNLAFIATGATARELAGAANGYVKLTSGAGKIRTGALRMFTSDFLTELLNSVNPFAATSDYSNLECTAILAVIEDGQILGDPVLVVKTDRLSVFADARVDLKSETLDADFNTAANKGLGLSMSNLINPYVKVQGTLAQPALALDGEGAIIGGGAAVATGGLSILAKSLKDRFFSAKDPCGIAVRNAESLFATLEKKYGSNPR